VSPAIPKITYGQFSVLARAGFEYKRLAILSLMNSAEDP
jgi:hypothetical protein